MTEAKALQVFTGDQSSPAMLALNPVPFLKTHLKVSAQFLLPGTSKSADNSLNLVIQDRELPKGLSDDYKTLMMNSSLGDLDATQNDYEYNITSDSYVYEDGIILSDLGWNIWISISLIIYCIGFVGNGYIIWLLGFQIKRNRFTTFILHLAIADSGFLASMVIHKIHLFTYSLRSNILFLFCAFFSHMMYINANFILTAISIDRCVAVLFPIWHHCSRPKGLSSMVCVLLWISSFLLTGSIVLFTNVFGKYNLFGLHFLVTAIVSLPLIILSTLVLFIKVCVKPKQKNQGRLLLMILITLLCFLILAFPLNVLVVIPDDELTYMAEN
ncbi:mas-related G-protein coupled receptor member H-like [Pseudonaja textilis]|uniref:mas-related G-protein coupled receptor member H-like n=1 Tax=Pseudonaja textilis TaxID=8673 RepID=UPI000EAA0B58|nr:mas-related G-protein coupled receptor member H-like [Pseudonaja textilis]